MKTNKITYYVATGLFTALMLFSVSNYFLQTEMIKGIFKGLGYPEYMVIPLGIAKVVGVAALWFSPNAKLREWAYACFTVNVVLAFFAHLMVGDGDQIGALIAFTLLALSYVFRTRAFA